MHKRRLKALNTYVVLFVCLNSNLKFEHFSFCWKGHSVSCEKEICQKMGNYLASALDSLCRAINCIKVNDCKYNSFYWLIIRQ